MPGLAPPRSGLSSLGRGPLGPRVPGPEPRPAQPRRQPLWQDVQRDGLL